MGMQQDKDFVKSMWQFQSAIEAINEENYEDAIIMLEHTICGLGFSNNNRSEQLLEDPEYGQYEYDKSVENLVNNIEKVGFAEHGAISYAFVIKLIVASYVAMGDSSNAAIWNTNFRSILEKHPEINQVGLNW